MKAPPELTNSPAPIAPPLYAYVSIEMRGSGVLNLHGDHLHVSSFQVLVKRVLGDHTEVFRVIAEFAIAIAFDLMAGRSVDMLLGQIAVAGFKTHCHGREEGG